MAKHPFKGRKGRLEVVTTVKGEDGTDQTDTVADANAAVADLSNDETNDPPLPQPKAAPVKPAKAKVKPVPVPEQDPDPVPTEPKPLPSTPKKKRASAAAVATPVANHRRRG